MRKPTRSELKAQIQDKGIVSAMRIGKTGLTKKQQKFTEALVLEGMNSTAAYREAYDHKGKPQTASVEAWKLKQNPKVAQTIEALERAKELAAYHSSETLRSLVISTLAEVATSETAKDATRVAAVKVLGTVVGVDAFRETKRIEHVQNSDEIREQILGQLKSMMLSTDDAVDVDADSLLAELAPIESDNQNGQDDSPTLLGDATFATGTPLDPLHTNPHEPSPEFSDPGNADPDPSEDPPLSEEMQTPGGDISGENDEVSK